MTTVDFCPLNPVNAYSNTGIADQFGHSVGIHDEKLIVSAVRERSSSLGVNGDELDDSLLDAGAAYIFSMTGGLWQQEAYIKASNTGNGDRFGSSVTIYGDSAVVGAIAEQSNATGSGGSQADNSLFAAGAYYIFEQVGSTWVQTSYLKPSDTTSGLNFGTSVSLHGDFLLSSAQGRNLASGAAYLFRRVGLDWEQEKILTAQEADVFDGSPRNIVARGCRNQESSQ